MFRKLYYLLHFVSTRCAPSSEANVVRCAKCYFLQHSVSRECQTEHQMLQKCCTGQQIVAGSVILLGFLRLESPECYFLQ